MPVLRPSPVRAFVSGVRRHPLPGSRVAAAEPFAFVVSPAVAQRVAQLSGAASRSLGVVVNAEASAVLMVMCATRVGIP